MDSIEFINAQMDNIREIKTRKETFDELILTEIESSVITILANATDATLNELKEGLNKIFKDSKCMQVILTKNVDKMFFGLNVCPVLPANKLFDIIESDDNYIVPKYFVEIDSKLADALIDNPQELTACILHDVSNLVGDSTPMKKVKANLDDYLVNSGTVLKYTESIHYLELLSLGIRDAMRKLTSMFDITQLEVDTNEFINSTYLAGKQTSALEIIKKNGLIPFEMIETPIVTLSWVLRLYGDIKKNRIAAKYTISKAIKFTASILDQKELKNIAARLDRISDDILIEGVLDDVADFIKSKFHNMKKNGIATYNNDLYEIAFNVKNMETQDEALLLIHKINTRMAVIADYLQTEPGLSRQEIVRWEKLYDKYDALREEISKSRIYQNKTRLYVNYGYDD